MTERDIKYKNLPDNLKKCIRNHIIKLKQDAHFFECILENRILDAGPYLPMRFVVDELFQVLTHYIDYHDDKKCIHPSFSYEEEIEVMNGVLDGGQHNAEEIYELID